jgi:ribosomal protein L11 methyltransferase
MPQSFTEIEIIADEQLADQLVAILSQLGFEGFWEERNSLRCYISRDRWSEAMLTEVQNVANTIHRSSASVAPRISVKNVEDKNWNEEWEKTIQPIHVTEKIVITPTWHEYVALPNELVLLIDPKMSFGTGYHETTRLVLKLMEKYLKEGESLLDVGTGTGVLAIAGIKLGASSAIGVDNDEWSFENAQENVQLNHVEREVKIMLGELSDVPSGQFDMIVANIQRNVIEPLLPQMKTMLNRNGILILSGLLDVDEQPMRKTIADCGFEIAELIVENEWVAFALQSAIRNSQSDEHARSIN